MWFALCFNRQISGYGDPAGEFNGKLKRCRRRGKVVLEKEGKEVQPLGAIVLTRSLRVLKVVAMQ